METIGRLARRFGLSRTTLLYYDRLGLLHASGRSEAGYRHYSAGDARRLELVCVYRSAGVPLADVRRILDGPRAALAAALEKRLAALQEEQARLRAQQVVVVRLLQRPDARRRRGLDKAGWVALLRAVGLDDADMDRWHAEFERMAPEAHQEFLESIGIRPGEARRIREGVHEARPGRSRVRGPKGSLLGTEGRSWTDSGVGRRGPEAMAQDRRQLTPARGRAAGRRPRRAGARARGGG